MVFSRKITSKRYNPKNFYYKNRTFIHKMVLNAWYFVSIDFEFVNVHLHHFQFQKVTV